MSWCIHPSKRMRIVSYDMASAPLQAENAKLRELVRDLYHFAIIADICPSKCPIESRCDNSEYCLCNELFDERMRELGIEVE